MKLSEIRAAIKAKANSTNIEQPVPNAPEPIVKPKPETTPVKPQIIQSTTTRKKKSSTNNILNENSNPAQNITTPVQSIPAKRSIKQQKRESRTKYLRPNQDYAVIPHTTKPTLLKGGAEKLASIFGFTTSCTIVNRIEHFDYDNPATSFVQYEAKVIVYNRDGDAISEGYGSCNSSESKFLKQPFANRINTVLKISKKRAYVDAILTATSASGTFTQDMEDIANFQDTSD